ncbi:hypothetical protein HMPREF0379_1263 [[Eubacterium] yurii subsp. margaretiae ATCC 43715]|nr:hypothetical protein HMPREF0379_1263 [[Eubacterium] yurii subsp. margaretiae ATCC 43715]
MNNMYKRKIRDFIIVSLLLFISISQILDISKIFQNQNISFNNEVISEQLMPKSTLFSCVILSLIYFVCIFYIINSLKSYKNEIKSSSIKEAFDNLPSAISIINANHMPLLVNKRMYHLIYMITEEYSPNVLEIVNIVENRMKHKNIKYIENGNDFIIQLKNGEIYKFNKSFLEIEAQLYTQIFFSDITREYNLSVELEEKNNALESQKKQLTILLDDIVNIKKEEEILMQKMYIHAKLGEIIIATNLYIRERKNQKYCLDLWEDLLIRLSAPVESKNEDTNLSQLVDASNAMGCEINLNGNLPEDNDMSYLIITAMRVAITNAVKHAKATQINVDIQDDDNNKLISISDNSTMITDSIQEGGGLRDLRTKIEKAGGRFEILCNQKVTLKISLPIKSIYS